MFVVSIYNKEFVESSCMESVNITKNILALFALHEYLSFIREVSKTHSLCCLADQTPVDTSRHLFLFMSWIFIFSYALYLVKW
jgi:hypothetical protein